MRASTIGNNGIVIPLAGLEAVKWAGLLCMTQEHVFRYVLGVFPFPVYVIGRMAFPLFAIALCRGVSNDQDVLRRVVGRLVVFGAAAQAARLLVPSVVPDLNVLFTFALGLIAALVINRGLVGLVAALCCVAASSFVEYGVFGVLFVMLLRIHCVTLRYTFLLAAAGCLAAANLSLVPLLAFFLAPALAYIHLERVRCFFYWCYVAQWPLIWGLRHVL